MTTISKEQLLNSLPLKLYKFYDQEGYARDFANRGRIKLGSIKSFAQTVDVTRKDETEGEGSVRIPSENVPVVSLTTSSIRGKKGEFKFSTSYLNPIFLFSMSLPETDMRVMREKWPFVVEIVDTKTFALDVEKSLTINPPEGKEFVDIDFVKVVYNKDFIGNRPEDIRERVRLSYSQKHPIYSYECEFRMAVKFPLGDFSMNEIFLQLDNYGEYTRLLPNNSLKRIGPHGGPTA